MESGKAVPLAVAFDYLEARADVERRLAVHGRGHGARPDNDSSPRGSRPCSTFSRTTTQSLRVNGCSAFGERVDLLSDHPLLGRQAEDGRRELILSRGGFGYVAKYRLDSR